MSCTHNDDACWNYENIDEWSKYFPYANGLRQSPININTLDTIPEFYPPFEFSSHYHHDQLFTLTNTGQQITGILTNKKDENKLWFTEGGLYGIYHFVNFHLHWGGNYRQGSEHELNGYQFSAEAHFVHEDRQNDRIAVLAFFLNVSDDISNSINCNEWEKYANIASQLTTIHNRMTYQFNLARLMPLNDQEYYRYVGSLTTPPCTEGIIWTIFSNEIMIKGENLDLLRRNIMRKTYRPVQPINGRTVFRNYQYPEII